MIWATANDIIDYCRDLTAVKSDFVVIGSTAFLLHGLQSTKPNDLDIVVKDLEGLKGDIHPYFTDSKHSKSGKRACILENGITKIDIFVENYLPEYEIIQEIRVASIDSIRLHYINLLPIVAEHWKKGILDRLNVLNYGK